MLTKASIRPPTRQSTIRSARFPRPPIHEPGSEINQQSRNSGRPQRTIVEELHTESPPESPSESPSELPSTSRGYANQREGRTPSPRPASHSGMHSLFLH